jgi:hypothetical protein
VQVDHRVLWVIYRPQALICDVTHVDLHEFWLVAVKFFSLGGDFDDAGVRSQGDNAVGVGSRIIAPANVAHNNVPPLPVAEASDGWPVGNTHVPWALPTAENPVAEVGHDHRALRTH